MAKSTAGKGKTIKGANLDRHRANCTICKHKQKDQLEELYLQGVSPWHISKLDQFSSLNHSSIITHVRVTGLKEQRDDSTLTKIDILLDCAEIQQGLPIKDLNISKLLELRAKLKGEYVEKPGDVNISQNFNMTPEQADKQRARNRVMGWEKLNVEVSDN